MAAPQPQPGIAPRIHVVIHFGQCHLTSHWSHYGLLVDCRNDRLLDGVTSLSASAQAASSLVPSVKVVQQLTSAMEELPRRFNFVCLEVR
jgi:hypothetical protein